MALVCASARVRTESLLISATLGGRSLLSVRQHDLFYALEGQNERGGLVYIARKEVDHVSRCRRRNALEDIVARHIGEKNVSISCVCLDHGLGLIDGQKEALVAMRLALVADVRVCICTDSLCARGFDSGESDGPITGSV